jgi:isoleucyl-tRNA synthetase
MVRTMRAQERQFSSSKVPFSKVVIEHTNEKLINDIQLIANLIQEEVNCIDIECKQSSNKYKYQIEFNQKNMGKKFKKDSKMIQDKLNQLSQEDIKEFYDSGRYSFNEFIVENNNDVIIQKVPMTDSIDSNVKTVLDGELMISVNFTYNQQILNTHLIRLFITKVQQLRKQSDLHPWNPIVVLYNDTLKQLLTDNKQFIESRLLCQIDHIGNRQLYDKPVYVNKKMDLNDDIFIEVVILRLD